MVGKRYTPKELRYIRKRHPHASARVIAAEMGRTQSGVQYIIERYNIKRTAKQKSFVYRQWPRTMPDGRVVQL